MDEVDIDTLSLEEYLTLTREEQGPGVVRPVIGVDVHFEIKNQFLRELRKDFFLETRTKMLMSILKCLVQSEPFQHSWSFSRYSYAPSVSDDTYWSNKNMD